MSNPVDDYLSQRDAEKIAAPTLNTVRARAAVLRAGGDPGKLRSWGQQFMGSAEDQLSGGNVAKAVVGGGLFAGGMGLAGAVNKAMQAITKKRDFEAMLEANPNLEVHRSNNPDQFNRHYTSFRSLNPRFAGDPVVAASYMSHMAEYPANAGKVIVESLKDRPKAETKFDLPMPPMMGTGKASLTYG
jgi:hypothetical protein